MGVVTVQVGPVLLHGVVGGARAIDVQAGGGPYEAGGPGRGVVVPAGRCRDPVVLAARRGLDLGVDIVDGCSDVLGHVLGRGAVVDEGVHVAGEDTFGVKVGGRGLEEQRRGRISRGGCYQA